MKIMLVLDFQEENGISECSGDYIITIDSDDYITFDFIEKLAKKAMETNCDIVSGEVKLVDNEGNEVVFRKVCRPLCYDKIITDIKEKIYHVRNEKMTFLVNKIVKKELYDKVKYSELRIFEDGETLKNLLIESKTMVYIKNEGYFYRKHDTQTTQKITYKEMEEYKRSVNYSFF